MHPLFRSFSGILLFYPVPFMRWPLVACKILGRTTAKYRWFAVFYLIIAFFVLPALILALSLAGQAPFLLIATPAFIVSG